jgi:Spy/CpxP family protein refolding chaperone
MVDHLASALDLTEAQKATATQLETAMRAQAAPLMQQSRQQRAELRTLLQSTDPDAAQIGEKVLAAHATRAQLKALHDEFDAKLKGILTADQQAKLGQLQQRRQRFQVNRPAPQDPGQ